MPIGGGYVGATPTNVYREVTKLVTSSPWKRENAGSNPVFPTKIRTLCYWATGCPADCKSVILTDIGGSNPSSTTESKSRLNYKAPSEGWK